MQSTGTEWQRESVRGCLRAESFWSRIAAVLVQRYSSYCPQLAPLSGVIAVLQVYLELYMNAAGQLLPRLCGRSESFWSEMCVSDFFMYVLNFVTVACCCHCWVDWGHFGFCWVTEGRWWRSCGAIAHVVSVNCFGCFSNHDQRDTLDWVVVSYQGWPLYLFSLAYCSVFTSFTVCLILIPLSDGEVF